MKESKIKSIRIQITMNKGAVVDAEYVHPDYRLPRSPTSPFKEMERSATKWVTNLINAVLK